MSKPPGADASVAAELPPLDLTFDEVRTMSEDIASQIEEHCVSTGERFDGALILPRGALEPANVILRCLDFDADQVISMGLKSYGSSKTRARIAEGQMPRPEDVKGKRLLLLDEVAETNRTGKHAQDWCYANGALLVRSAFLVTKPELAEVEMDIDWHIMQTKRWVNFPWEKYDIKGEKSVVNSRRER